MRIFIAAGEPSGDRHAARLMEQLRLLIPDVIFEGIGGPAMELQGLHSMARIADLAVSGFWEVAKRYSFFRSLLKRCGNVITNAQGSFSRGKPALLICVDYPGFNMRLAAIAREAGVPVCYYIAPQLWAWGKNRGPNLASVVNKLLVVFPFEVEFFRSFGIDVHHVGHPLLDDPNYASVPDHTHNSVAFMPGSRAQELHRHAPLLAETARLLLRDNPTLSISSARPSNIPLQAYSAMIDAGITVSDDARQVLRTSGAGIIKAGTSTLEAALTALPFATFYLTSALSYALSKRLVTVNSVTMLNLLLHQQVINEYLQRDATPKNLAAEVRTLLSDTPRRAEIRDACMTMRAELGGSGASARAAAIAAQMVQR
ncbi:lipid-A-disaccharide synthase [soil metagenome]